MKEMCRECNESVAFGSGKFINRIPGDDDNWLCAECDENEARHDPIPNLYESGWLVHDNDCDCEECGAL